MSSAGLGTSDGDSAGGVVVVGAGLMGVGIAQVFAQAGHDVRLVETDSACRKTALSRLALQLTFLVDRGRLARGEADEAFARVSLSGDLEESLSPPPLLVVEAITEDLERKRALFATCDRLTPPSSILASNSSGLSITAMAEGLGHPGRVCGAHFWNPPHLIPLVEVIFGQATTRATVDQVVRLLEAAGKRPVAVLRDVPGFIGNRLLHALQKEAMSLVERGVASAADVDLVVTHGFGRRLGVLGPLAVCDLAGLDLILDVDSYLLADLDRSPDPSPLLRRLVEEGRLGAKSGRGFHEWTAESLGHAIEARDDVLLQALDRDAGEDDEA